MPQSERKTKKRSTTFYKRKNHFTKKRRKDHFTKKRKKIKSKYNKRSVKRNRKTIKRNKRKYRGGATKLIRVKFEDYYFYVQITPYNISIGYNLEDPNSSGIMSIRSQVDYLILKDSDGRKDDFNFTLELLDKGKGYPPDDENYYRAYSYHVDSHYDHTYELIPESDFLVELCYSCSTLNKWDALEKEDVTVRWKSMISYRVEILENILNRMNLEGHREQFKYASEILYYLMKISDNDLCKRLITRFKDILGDDFNTIAENRICRVWAHRNHRPRQFETIISPKCIIDERLLGFPKTKKLKDLFNGIQCNRCKVEVTSDTIKEGNSPFTQYTITLTEPDGSTDSFKFRWKIWIHKKDEVLAILKESRANLEPLIYTDKDYFSNSWFAKSVNVETVAKRIQMLTAIFNRQDLGEPGLFDESIYDLDFQIPDGIGELEKKVTELVPDSIKKLYYDIKKIFDKTPS